MYCQQTYVSWRPLPPPLLPSVLLAMKFCGSSIASCRGETRCEIIEVWVSSKRGLNRARANKEWRRSLTWRPSPQKRDWHSSFEFQYAVLSQNSQRSYTKRNPLATRVRSTRSQRC